MSDPTTPVWIEVPGPHLGKDKGWAGAELRSGQTLVGGRLGLGLPAQTDGPLGLGSRDGSLGRVPKSARGARAVARGGAMPQANQTRPRAD